MCFPFLRRYLAADPVLLTATVCRHQALALKLGREEQEVIVNPTRLQVSTVESIAS